MHSFDREKGRRWNDNIQIPHWNSFNEFHNPRHKYVCFKWRSATVSTTSAGALSSEGHSYSSNNCYSTLLKGCIHRLFRALICWLRAVRMLFTVILYNIRMRFKGASHLTLCRLPVCCHAAYKRWAKISQYSSGSEVRRPGFRRNPWCRIWDWRDAQVQVSGLTCLLSCTINSPQIICTITPPWYTSEVLPCRECDDLQYGWDPQFP